MREKPSWYRPALHVGSKDDVIDAHLRMMVCDGIAAEEAIDGLIKPLIIIVNRDKYSTWLVSKSIPKSTILLKLLIVHIYQCIIL